MKKNYFLTLLACLFVVSFATVSCSDSDNDGDYSNELNVLGGPLEFGSAGGEKDLTVTTTASGYTFKKNDWITITQSADKKTVTVSVAAYAEGRDGKITFSASGAKDVEVVVEQKKEGENPGGGEGPSAVLEGSDYYVFMLDDASYAKIASKVTLDLRPNDDTQELQLYEGTYEGFTTTGMNYFGATGQSWVGIQMTSASNWSAGGFNYKNRLDLSGITADHTLHIALKSQNTYNQVFYLQDGTGSGTGGFTLGTAQLGNDVYPIVGNFTRDGEWHGIEVPMSTIIGQNFDPTATFDMSTTGANGNLVVFVSEWIAGYKLEFDAFFIYKK